MPFPTGWPPRIPSGTRNLRVYIADTATADYSDNAYLFADLPGANPYTPLPEVRPGEGVSAPDYGGPHVVPATPAGTGAREGDPHPMTWSEGIEILNLGAATIYFSFDGVRDHGEVPAAVGGVPGRTVMWRREAGIAIRGVGNDFVVHAW